MNKSNDEKTILTEENIVHLLNVYQTKYGLDNVTYRYNSSTKCYEFLYDNYIIGKINDDISISEAEKIIDNQYKNITKSYVDSSNTGDGAYYRPGRKIDANLINIDVNEDDIISVINKINSISSSGNDVSDSDIAALKNTISGELKSRYESQSSLKSCKIGNIKSLIMEYGKKVEYSFDMIKNTDNVSKSLLLSVIDQIFSLGTSTEYDAKTFDEKKSFLENKLNDVKKMIQTLEETMKTKNTNLGVILNGDEMSIVALFKALGLIDNSIFDDSQQKNNNDITIYGLNPDAVLGMLDKAKEHNVFNNLNKYLTGGSFEDTLMETYLLNNGDSITKYEISQGNHEAIRLIESQFLIKYLSITKQFCNDSDISSLGSSPKYKNLVDSNATLADLLDYSFSYSDLSDEEILLSKDFMKAMATDSNGNFIYEEVLNNAYKDYRDDTNDLLAMRCYQRELEKEISLLEYHDDKNDPDYWKYLARTYTEDDIKEIVNSMSDLNPEIKNVLKYCSQEEIALVMYYLHGDKYNYEETEHRKFTSSTYLGNMGDDFLLYPIAEYDKNKNVGVERCKDYLDRIWDTLNCRAGYDEACKSILSGGTSVFEAFKDGVDKYSSDFSNVSGMVVSSTIIPFGEDEGAGFSVSPTSVSTYKSSFIISMYEAAKKPKGKRGEYEEILQNIDQLQGYSNKFSYTVANQFGNMFIPILSGSVTGSNLVGATLVGVGASGNSAGYARSRGLTDNLKLVEYSFLNGLSEASLTAMLSGIPGLGKAFRSGKSFLSKCLGEAKEEFLQAYIGSGLNTTFLGDEYNLGNTTKEALNGAFYGFVLSAMANGMDGLVRFAYNGRTYNVNSADVIEDLTAHDGDANSYFEELDSMRRVKNTPKVRKHLRSQNVDTAQISEIYIDESGEHLIVFDRKGRKRSYSTKGRNFELESQSNVSIPDSSSDNLDNSGTSSETEQVISQVLNDDIDVMSPESVDTNDAVVEVDPVDYSQNTSSEKDSRIKQKVASILSGVVIGMTPAPAQGAEQLLAPLESQQTEMSPELNDVAILNPNLEAEISELTQENNAKRKNNSDTESAEKAKESTDKDTTNTINQDAENENLIIPGTSIAVNRNSNERVEASSVGVSQSTSADTGSVTQETGMTTNQNPGQDVSASSVGVSQSTSTNTSSVTQETGMTTSQNPGQNVSASSVGVSQSTSANTSSVTQETGMTTNQNPGRDVSASSVGVSQSTSANTSSVTQETGMTISQNPGQNVSASSVGVSQSTSTNTSSVTQETGMTTSQNPGQNVSASSVGVSQSTSTNTSSVTQETGMTTSQNPGQNVSASSVGVSQSTSANTSSVTQETGMTTSQNPGQNVSSSSVGVSQSTSTNTGSVTQETGITTNQNPSFSTPNIFSNLFPSSSAESATSTQNTAISSSSNPSVVWDVSNPSSVSQSLSGVNQTTVQNTNVTATQNPSYNANNNTLGASSTVSSTTSISTPNTNLSPTSNQNMGNDTSPTKIDLNTTSSVNNIVPPEPPLKPTPNPKHNVPVNYLPYLIAVPVIGAVVAAITLSSPKLTLELLGNSIINIDQYATYVEPGYVAKDDEDGDLTSKVIVSGEVDTNNAGTYVLNYSVTNSRNETQTKDRKVNVIKKNQTKTPPPVNPPSNSNNIFTTNDYYSLPRKYKLPNNERNNLTFITNSYLNYSKKTVTKVFGMNIIADGERYKELSNCDKTILKQEASLVSIYNNKVLSSFHETKCYDNYGIFYAITPGKLIITKVSNKTEYDKVISDNPRDTFIYEKVLIKNGVVQTKSEKLTNNTVLCATGSSYKTFAPKNEIKEDDYIKELLNNQCTDAVLLPGNEYLEYSNNKITNIITRDNQTFDSIMYFE